MSSSVHTLMVDLEWSLLDLVSKIDRFDASWTSIEIKEGRSLKQLKEIATVKSVGASTRIEGSEMSDEQVEALLAKLDITKMEDRDEQEVAGYFKTFDLISSSYQDIDITQENIKSLHKQMLTFSDKDEWHRGDYKQLSNSVEAKFPDGRRQVIFQTAEPGMPTEDAMNAMVNWYARDTQTHNLVKVAILAYEFVTIHPFQDGNGRLSRLLAILALLQNGYRWVQYISFEHEIEARKAEYYQVLQECQANRPGEEVNNWLIFFFSALIEMQEKLMKKLAIHGIETKLGPKEKSVLTFIQERPGSKTGDISKKINIPISTVKRILSKLIKYNLIEKYGVGPGTNYTAI